MLLLFTYCVKIIKSLENDSILPCVIFHVFHDQFVEIMIQNAVNTMEIFILSKYPLKDKSKVIA